MSEENPKEINKKKMNQIKTFINQNDSNSKKPIFKKNKFLIEANIKQKIDENIKYNLEEIPKKEIDKSQTNYKDQAKYDEEPKKIDEALPKANLNGENSKCEFNIKTKKTKHQEKSNKAKIKRKKLFVSDIDLKIKSKKIMNMQNKKSSKNLFSINKDKEKYHSFYEIKESSDTQLQISNLEGLFIPNAKTENISLNNFFQESKSDKNPSEISGKYIEVIRKENLIFIDNAMAKMREENNLFIKAFAKEMFANLTVILKESNTDLVNKIFEKMNNK